MFAELAQYVYPKQKAVELAGKHGDPMSVAIMDKLLAATRRSSNALLSCNEGNYSLRHPGWSSRR